MQAIANIFLIIFLNDAVIGIVSFLFAAKPGLEWLAGLHDFAGRMTLFFAMAVYFGFAINRHLPKRVLVPPLLFLGWKLIAFWPLQESFAIAPSSYMLLGQLLLGLLVLQLNLKLNRKSPLLVREQFNGPAFGPRRFALFLLLAIPLLPLLVVLLCFSSVSNLIDDQAAGFMRLRPDGIYMVEKQYRRGEKNIRLSSMIHVGQQSYFDSLAQDLRGQKAIFLLEGVSDRTGRLKGNFSYQRLASLLGLATQESMPLEGRLIDAASLDDLVDKQAKEIDLLPADIDLAEFDRHTIRLLNALAYYVLDAENLADGFRDFNQWTRENSNTKTQQTVMNDLVTKRNRKLLSYLPKALNKYDTVVIPWGALHMPEIEHAVQGQGFRLQQQQERLSIDFLKLPYAKIWQALLPKD